jgi:RHS repeat-associated protein
MSRASRSLSLLVLLISAALPAYAQGPTRGTPPFGSFAGGPDVINLANLNSHLDIPVLNKPGRGTNFTYDLNYNSSIWFPVGSTGSQTWQPVSNFGWQGTSEPITGFIEPTGTTLVPCPDPPSPVKQETAYVAWIYHDKFGGVHHFSAEVAANLQGTTCPFPRSATATLNDGSGYKVTVTAAPSATVTTASGQVFQVPVTNGSAGASATDRNGNQITLDGAGHFTDTLGTVALTVAGSGTSISPITLSYTAPNGQPAKYTLNYTNYTIATNFAVSGISEYKSTEAVPLVSSIVLPDGSLYTFTYEATPSLPSASACTPFAGTTCVTARVASIALPTGGSITYAYSGGSGTNNSGIFSDGSTATLARKTTDTGSASWTYTQVKGTGAASTTTITDPTGNQTTVSFQGIYETQRQVFQGSTSGTLLSTTNTCYNGTASPTSIASCTGTAVTLPITQRAVTTILPGAKALTSQHIDYFNVFGGPTESDDYDYGSGAVGALLRKTAITYASLQNITAFRQTVTVTNGAGATVSQTNNNYDETAVATSSNTPQHTTITGSRGNLTSINYPVSGLTAHATYFDTGTVQTSTDVNGAVTTFSYPDATSTCGNTWPTSSSTPVNSTITLTSASTWNCTGGVATSTTDANGNATTTAYANNPNYWLPDSTTDPTNAITHFTYNGQTSAEAALSVNSGSSTSDILATVDSFGRPRVQQTRQAPGSSNFDSVETDYDGLGRPTRTTLPYAAAAGALASPSAPRVTTLYDALSRPTMLTDAGGGFTSYSYSQNDVFVTIGPAASGENTKRRQLEYDALGRLTSVCEITAGTTAAPAGACAQNSSQTGYWTTYAYDALGNLLTSTQNAQAASGSQQTRSYTFDPLSRLTSETNPETAKITYTYDSDTTCASFVGDRVKRIDSAGNTTCFAYDKLHRVISQTYTGTGPNVANTPNRYFVYDSATVNGVALANAKGQLAEAYTTAPGTASTAAKVTDLGFSYTVRGQVSDVLQMSPSSSGYYHATYAYFENGATKQLSGLPGLPTFTYGLDGEGRMSALSASAISGQLNQNPLSGVTYNAASQPTAVTLGSGDSDNFTYDPNTGRMTQYQFKVNTQSFTGNLAWNANSTLGSLSISDPFNAADTQNCSYTHDDLTRVASANCGATTWQQTFSYDAFGNLTKSVPTGGTGNSFQPTYNAKNQYATLPGATPSYDANGNVLTDGAHSYTWDAAGRYATIDGTAQVSDALGRLVDIIISGGPSLELFYGPDGLSRVGFQGQTPRTGKLNLPGGGSAIYDAENSGLFLYSHSDHLGSTRLLTTPARAFSQSQAYAPFGEPYATSSLSPYQSFTGQNSHAGLDTYSFLYRQYGDQGRWVSPDPAGLAAVDRSNPQSWNRYAYVLNNPLALVDSLGLECAFLNDSGNGIAEYAPELIGTDCTNQGGVYFSGSIDPNSIQFDPNSDFVFAQGAAGNQFSCGGANCDQGSLDAFANSLFGQSSVTVTASITVGDSSGGGAPNNAAPPPQGNSWSHPLTPPTCQQWKNWGKGDALIATGAGYAVKQYPATAPVAGPIFAVFGAAALLENGIAIAGGCFF